MLPAWRARLRVLLPVTMLTRCYALISSNGRDDITYVDVLSLRRQRHATLMPPLRVKACRCAMKTQMRVRSARRREVDSAQCVMVDDIQEECYCFR